jgi:hypothetical protein
MDEHAESAAHEPSTIDLRALAVAAAIVACGIAMALAAPWFVLARAPSAANAPNNAARPAIEGPVQPTAPALELKAYRDAKRLPGVMP